MAEVQNLTVVKLTNNELCRAICEYVERMNAGDMPSMNPGTIQVHVPLHGDVYLGATGGLTVTVSNHKS